MRLWTIHPKYLDASGLVAAWREGLLAQKVLQGGTRGYRNHPQLIRFQEQKNPLESMGAFLHEILQEACCRGYQFNASKITVRGTGVLIEETQGQLQREWQHLMVKLRKRSPQVAAAWEEVHEPDPHPIFRMIPGEKRNWEKS